MRQGRRTTPAGGAVYVHATGNNGPAGTIIITGAIGDYGKTLSIDRNGKTDTNGNYVKITLHKGTFEVNSTVLNAKTNHAQPIVQQGDVLVPLRGDGPGDPLQRDRAVQGNQGEGAHHGQLRGGWLVCTQSGPAQGPMQPEQQRTDPCSVGIDHGPGNGFVQLDDLRRRGPVRPADLLLRSGRPPAGRPGPTTAASLGQRRGEDG